MTDEELTDLLQQIALQPPGLGYNEDWLKWKAKSLMVALGAIMERLGNSKMTMNCEDIKVTMIRGKP